MCPEASPRRNRVTPEGEIIAVARRGSWTGNRGCVHRDGEIVRAWASHHWLICALRHRDWWHEQWVPGRLTWLYFTDEAVAFAAGHRPCALCRRQAWTSYAHALGGAGHDDVDRRLHAERLAPGRGPQLARRRRLHCAEWPSLPDGAFVIDDGTPALVRGSELVSWGSDGYGERRRRPRAGTARLLTPPSTVQVLRAGYPVQIDDAVNARRRR